MDSQTRNRLLYDAAKQARNMEFIALLQQEPDALNVMTPFGSWLHVAATVGNDELVRYLVNRGLDPSIKGGTHKGGAINLAASNGHLKVVQYLLSCGAQVDTSEPERNPLFAAIYGGHADVAMCLLDSGIDASIKYSGQSMKEMDAVAFAKERGQLEIAEVIERHLANRGTH
jgi:ankyrin repeat protein